MHTHPVKRLDAYGWFTLPNMDACGRKGRTAAGDGGQEIPGGGAEPLPSDNTNYRSLSGDCETCRLKFRDRRKNAAGPPTPKSATRRCRFWSAADERQKHISRILQAAENPPARQSAMAHFAPLG